MEIIVACVDLSLGGGGEVLFSDSKACHKFIISDKGNYSSSVLEVGIT